MVQCFWEVKLGSWKEYGNLCSDRSQWVFSYLLDTWGRDKLYGTKVKGEYNGINAKFLLPRTLSVKWENFKKNVLMHCQMNMIIVFSPFHLCYNMEFWIALEQWIPTFSPPRTLLSYFYPTDLMLSLKFLSHRIVLINFVVLLNWKWVRWGGAARPVHTSHSHNFKNPFPLSCSHFSQKIRESPSSHHDQNILGVLSCIKLWLEGKGRTTFVSFCAWNQRWLCMNAEPDEKQSVVRITSYCSAKFWKRSVQWCRVK